MVSRIFVIFILCGVLSKGKGQGLSIKRTLSPVVVDGIMDEKVWQTADSATNFMQYFPTDSAKSFLPTTIRATYDNENIYFFARMASKDKRAYVTPSLRRDYRGESNDGISILLDPFKDRTNGYLFGVNPFGVQREGLLANGGNQSADLSLNWDNKWFSVTKLHKDYWVAEIAIPFKSIRYKAGQDNWFVNFYRVDSHYGERSTWSPIPQFFLLINMASFKDLHWDQPLPKSGRNISLIPYASLGSSKNFARRDELVTTKGIGLDAKIAIGTSLNMDLTFNPDFSQVEVDEQVTNLDRFEIFFPERRQFFLENADLFSDFGITGTRPFFSRRIGVAIDTATGQNIQNPIYGGLRISGKLDNNWRVGLMNMQAGEDLKIGLPSTNFTVATMQRKLFSRSNIGMIFINKQAFQNGINEPIIVSPLKFNRVFGVDYNLATKDNAWTGKFFYHTSFDQLEKGHQYASGGTIEYSKLRWSASLLTRSVSADYNPEAGFVRRRDIIQLAHNSWLNFYPKNNGIQSHGPGFDFDMIGNNKYGFLDWDVNLMYRLKWKNTALANFRLRRQFTYLFSAFDPSGTNSVTLPSGTGYYNNLFVGNFSSDARKPFFYNLSTRSGGYFLGTILNLVGSATYRFTPYGFISLNFSLNHIRQPDPYADANLYLFGPRFDVTATKSLFFTAFIQYNNQLNNLNINARLQWRFKPVSDMFLVYTDNYATESFTDELGIIIPRGAPRLRGVIFKVNYWFNM
jgi:hypothetical protein